MKEKNTKLPSILILRILYTDASHITICIAFALSILYRKCVCQLPGLYADSVQLRRTILSIGSAELIANHRTKLNAREFFFAVVLNLRIKRPGIRMLSIKWILY